MATFTLVDGIVLALIALSAILAYARGLARELLSIVGWIAAAVAGFWLAPSVEPLVREVPLLRDVIGTSCELGILAGFAIVFAIALVVVSLFTPLLAGAVANSALGPVDQGLGFLFGIVRGVAARGDRARRLQPHLRRGRRLPAGRRQPHRRGLRRPRGPHRRDAPRGRAAVDRLPLRPADAELHPVVTLRRSTPI